MTDRNGNENCLDGFACPRCGEHDKLIVTGAADFELTDAGTDDFGDVTFDDDSPARCSVCDFAGRLKDFGLDGPEQNVRDMDNFATEDDGA